MKEPGLKSLAPNKEKKKFTEPVALSSPEPVGFPLPRTAPRPGFDLLALRARCKRHTTRPAKPHQEGENRKACYLHIFRFDRADKRFLLLALETGTKKIRRAGCAFVPRTG